MIRDPLKTPRIVGSSGGYITTRGRPRYTYLQGRHFAVANGRAWECDTIKEASAKVDDLLRVARAKDRCVCGAIRADHGAVAPFTIGDRCDGFRLEGARR